MERYQKLQMFIHPNYQKFSICTRKVILGYVDLFEKSQFASDHHVVSMHPIYWTGNKKEKLSLRFHCQVLVRVESL